MASACLLFIVISAFGMNATRLYIDHYQFLPRFLLLLILLLGALFYRWRREEKLLNLVMVTFWAVLFSTLHLFPMFIATRFSVNLSDGLLARFDRALGVEVPTVLAWMGHNPVLRSSLGVCYSTLILLMTIAIVVPPLRGDMRAAKQYAIACVVSAMISMPLFGVFQAVGPWIHYGYSPQLDQSNYLNMFHKLKSSGPALLDVSFRDGLICFPSFHTVLAVLAAYALWRIPYLRWTTAIWATLIVVSTVTTGTHYVIDVVAGVAVAVLSIGAARGYSALESRLSRGSKIGDTELPRRTTGTSSGRLVS